MNNSIFVIHPYLHHNALVFDDPSVGLVKEAFVAGADTVIAILASRITSNWKDGFDLYFSSRPFPGYQAKMIKVGPQYDGTVYHCEELNIEGWLCPALFKYFDVAPDELYIQIKEG